jgi:hypothetical protein
MKKKRHFLTYTIPTTATSNDAVDKCISEFQSDLEKIPGLSLEKMVTIKLFVGDEAEGHADEYLSCKQKFDDCLDAVVGGEVEETVVSEDEE